ncbi:hypothetical protein [Reyranella sp.]|uniref:winged helix domain-containing protein n=1 Tax=Reyranella sp. TaxID=1929291 RepID=UPI001201E22E|nr:hypothetical protein [Reyranella sp.]TAJ82883.1 MAG: hypothetical protein EPO50_24590 [Reyranella sp.]
MRRVITAHFFDRPPLTITIQGKRPNWLLDILRTRGDTGTTSIEHPGVRVADAVLKLRRAGLAIETITERHEGAFAGNHARYVLRVERVDIEREAA